MKRLPEKLETYGKGHWRLGWGITVAYTMLLSIRYAKLSIIIQLSFYLTMEQIGNFDPKSMMHMLSICSGGALSAMCNKLLSNLYLAYAQHIPLCRTCGFSLFGLTQSPPLVLKTMLCSRLTT